MCKPSETMLAKAEVGSTDHRASEDYADEKVPIQTVLVPPSLASRYTCASVLLGIFAIWGKLTFIDEEDVPGGRNELHSWRVPVVATLTYLVSLPLLRFLSKRFIHGSVDVKVLLRESMILYNAGQVLLNGWMMWKILDALFFRGHPFVAGPIHLVNTGASYAVWVHYCDKYLEFIDTYFMVLRGKMDQVRMVSGFVPRCTMSLKHPDKSHRSCLDSRSRFFMCTITHP